MSKYIKSNSNFVLKSNPTATSKGYIYENDWLTTIKSYSTINGNIISNTSGGFGLISNATPDESKNYNVDGWGNKTYTLGDIALTAIDFKTNMSNTATEINQKKYVKLNNTHTDLSKFCYFGSSNAMLNSAVNNIIDNFPAALYITTSNNIISGTTISIPINDIENKFNIDLFDYYPEERVNLIYNLRTFVTSYLDYEIVNENEEFIGNIIGFTGYTTGNTSNIIIQLSNFIESNSYFIKPNPDKCSDFFNNLDDFESAILNRYSIPKYKSYFNSPTENVNGIIFEYKSFIWPTSDGYNIDIESSSYVSFMTDLVDATNFIDETYCDNLYRMLTHDTIKNLDFAYQCETDELKLEDIIIGGSKIQKILRLYGRSYDEIKKYIEGISFVNTVTYNKKYNLPIEYLDTKLDTSGWDVFSILSNINKNTTTSSKLFESTSENYKAEDVNNELLRRIAINSNYIFRSKGTKKSIRKMFGLLGFEDNWYEMREYTQLVDNLISGETLEKIASLNYAIYPDSYSISDGKNDYEYSFDQSLFDNTNVGIFVKCPYCGSEDYYADIDDGITGTCISCHRDFIITGSTIGYPKPLKNSPNYYFQGKGNWYRETGGNHTDFTGLTNYVNEISYGNNPHIGFDKSNNTWYDDGYDYVDQFSNLFKRFIRNSGEINVVDITAYTNNSYTSFTTNKKKTFIDKKIKYSNGLHDNSLTLNLKNFIIGFDGDKILESFSTENSEINNIKFTSGLTDITLIPTSDFIKIENEEYNSTLTINGLNNNEKIKLIVDSKSVSPIELKFENQSMFDIYIVSPGINYLITKENDGDVIISLYHGDDEVNLLKSIALPYIEQLVPSTSIFDLVQINANTPKWQLVDKYLYRDPLTGNYDGDTILEYQNINYFDNESINYNQELVNKINKDFGPNFIYYGNKLKTDDRGFDNIYLFKGRLEDSLIDANPLWIIDENLI